MSEPDVVAAWQRAGGRGEAYPAATGFRGGAIRASVGLVSTIDDVETFLALITRMRQ